MFALRCLIMARQSIGCYKMVYHSQTLEPYLDTKTQSRLKQFCSFCSCHPKTNPDKKKLEKMATSAAKKIFVLPRLAFTPNTQIDQLEVRDGGGMGLGSGSGSGSKTRAYMSDLLLIWLRFGKARVKDFRLFQAKKCFTYKQWSRLTFCSNRARWYIYIGLGSTKTQFLKLRDWFEIKLACSTSSS